MYKIKKKTSFIHVVLKKPVHLMSTFFHEQTNGWRFSSSLKIPESEMYIALLFPHVWYALFK